MALQEFGFGIVIDGLVASSFKSSVKYINTSIIEIEKNRKKLSQTKLGINGFKELSYDASKNCLKLAQFSHSLKNASRDIKLLQISLLNLKKASVVELDITLHTVKKITKTDTLTQSQIKLNKVMMTQSYGFKKMDNVMKYMSLTITNSLSPVVDVLATGLSHISVGLKWVDEKASWLIPTVVGLITGFKALTKAIKIGSDIKKTYLFVTDMLKNSTTLATAKTKAYALWQGIVATKTKVATFATGLYSRSMIFSGIALNALGAKLKAFSLVSSIATAKQWLFNLALNANPIGLIITGIAALGAGAVWLYKNFEPFTNLIDGIWENAKKFFGWISGKISLVTDAFSGISTFFGLNSEEDTEESKEREKKENHEVKKTESNTSFFGSFFSQEKKKKEINRVDNIGNTTSTHKKVNSINFKGLKKVVAPIAMTTALVASPVNIPESKLHTQSLNIPSQKEMQVIRDKSTQTMHNNNSTLAPIHKNYTINITVQNPSSSIDITEAVKQAIKSIEDENRESSMEDTY